MNPACAWCEASTGELLVPGRGSAFVHPSCEAKRRGRRWFLGAIGLGASAIIAAPLLDLVPEAGGWRNLAGHFEFYPPDQFTNINALMMEKYREIIPRLYEREDSFYVRLRRMSEVEKAQSSLRIPVAMR